MRTSPLVFFKAKGNMVEYVLPAVLIGMVAVAGLSWSLSGQFAAQGGRSLFQAELSQVGANGKTLLVTRSFGKNPNLQPLSLTLKNGETIQIPDIPLSVTDNIDVDGGHGTTEKLLAALEKLRKALVEAGELTEADSQPFKDLANAGHGFGKTQAFVENIISQCGQNKKCVSDQIYQDGNYVDALVTSGIVSARNSSGVLSQSVNARALTEQEFQTLDAFAPFVKDLISTDPYFNYDIQNLRVGQTYGQYLKSYQQVMDIPNIKGTPTANLVQKLANNILFLQAASYNTTGIIANSLNFSELQNNVNENRGTWANVLPEDYQSELKKYLNQPDVKSALISDVTHAHAGGICAAGQRSDDGTYCH